MTSDADTTVLVVEDERELADTYTRWLAESYTTRTAYSGEEALEKLDDEIDVVLLDRRLPGISGGDVLEEIRERSIPCRVAMITAVDPDFDILEMAFDDYIVKPVLKEEINALVERLLKLSTYDDQFRESYGLASKLTVLKEEKSSGELTGNEEYTGVKGRLETLREEIDETLSEFDDRDFERVYRDL